MWKCVGPLLLLVTGFTCATSPAAQGPSTPPAGPAGSEAQRARQLAIAIKPWKGDFDGMLERRVGNISRMRREAEKRGLDPNLWFNNVETVTAEKIGIETTTYVRNIFKYYVSYKLAVESGATAAKVRQQVAPGK